MTAKHSKQKYTEKQTRLAAKMIKGAYTEISTDSQIAKKKARVLLEPTSANDNHKGENLKLFQEFIPFHKRKKKNKSNKKRK